MNNNIRRQTAMKQEEKVFLKDDDPFLSLSDSVDQIVREFASGFVRRYGVIDHQQFLNWLVAECDRMNALFLREDLENELYRRDAWHTPQQLGRHLTQAMGIEGELELAVRDAFMIFAAKLGELMRENQTPATETRLKQALDLLVDDFIEKLLGCG